MSGRAGQGPGRRRGLDNRAVAARLREAAELIAARDDEPFRARAYRRAADTVEAQRRDVLARARDEGAEGLRELDGVGPGIAAALLELSHRGRWGLLDRLREDADPVTLFQEIPGVGPVLAERFAGELGVESLEGLEIAAHDGRLADLDGVGPGRVAGIRAALQAMLGARRGGTRSHDAPAVSELLAVDAIYRREAGQGTLPSIAPRRFNPDGEAWLPVLRTRRGRWRYTALHSNTARADELDRVRDWVVIFHRTGDDDEGQHTVVTERSGPLAGRRVVRGRESECIDHYGTVDEAPE